MIALARKYRPRRFADLLVQDHVAAALRGAVARGRVGHGYLLTGPRGVGTTTAARILAMALNCERRDAGAGGEPCGECTSCERVWSGAASLDVVEIDAASNRGVDDARELRERAMYAPSQEGHHKVYIVDEAHMLTREAWNALLKILEEPPPGVIFVFATTEPQKIAATASPVLSRLQRFDFRRIGPAAIRDRLAAVMEAEGLETDDEALALIASHADGGMRDALSILDQCLSFGEGRIAAAQVRDVLGLVSEAVYAEVLRLVAAQEPAAVFPVVDQLMQAGADLVEFIGGLGAMLRALLLASFDTPQPDLTERMRQAIAAARADIAPEDAVRMLRLLTETEATIKRSGSPRLAVETLLLRWAMMDRTVDLDRVLAGEPPAAPAPAKPRAASPPAPRADRRAAAVTDAPTPPPDDRAGGPGLAATVGTVPFTAESLAGIWKEVVAAARGESRFLAEALASCQVGGVAPPELRLVVPPEQGVLVAAVEKGRATVERLVADRVGAPVRLMVSSGTAAAEERPRRQSAGAQKAERLRGLRGADPALDAAVDELDLEIVDERPPRG